MLEVLYITISRFIKKFSIRLLKSIANKEYTVLNFFYTLMIYIRLDQFILYCFNNCNILYFNFKNTIIK